MPPSSGAAFVSAGGAFAFRGKYLHGHPELGLLLQAGLLKKKLRFMTVAKY
jgi:hypothetical protein